MRLSMIKKNHFDGKIFWASIILGIFVLLFLTLGAFPITQDETIYIQSAKSFDLWLQFVKDSVMQGQAHAILDADNIRRYWDVFHEHPSFLKILSALTWRYSHKQLGEYHALRLATVIGMSVFLGLVGYLLNKKIHWLVGIGAVFMMLSHPRIFGYMHLAEITIQLTWLWFVILILFERGVSQNRYGYLAGSGLLWGLACAAKVTSVLILPVCVVYMLTGVTTRNFRHWLGLGGWGLLGCLSFIASWPMLWGEGLSFFSEHIGHFYRENQTILTYYMGAYYQNLPWHYPWIMFLVTMPVSWLVTVAYGIYRAVRVKDSFGILCLINAIVVMGSLSLYTSYPGDGIRHFLMVYPGLFYLGALGLWHAWKGTQSEMHFGNKIPKRLVRIFIVGIIGVTIFENIIVFPRNFEYYNVLVKGTEGAVRRGFEARYYK